MKIPRTVFCALLACLGCASVIAQDVKPTVDASGTITTVGGKIPFSQAASKEALKRFQEILLEDKAAPGITHPLESRKFYDRINTDRAERMKKLYPVKIEHTKIGGVPVDIVSTVDAKPDDKRVLINLHGGAFLWGAGSGGLVEAIPVASVSKIKVITVDYREGPEDQFPAATEDVEKVYRAVLAHHGAENIGIYGCSAGGGLTAQALLAFEDHQLPLPAAIGIFCSGVSNMRGDSASIGPMLMGQALPKSSKPDGANNQHPYFKGQAFKDFVDRLNAPGAITTAIAKFPPTLLISGTRDMALSDTLVSNEMLGDAGVATELHVWEGMWHSFFSDPELPESKAAYAVIARFFDRHLGHAPSASAKRP
jgi:acetyl esterase/lipase